MKNKQINIAILKILTLIGALTYTTHNAHAHGGHIANHGIEGHTHWFELMLVFAAWGVILKLFFVIKKTLRIYHQKKYAKDDNTEL